MAEHINDRTPVIVGVGQVLNRDPEAGLSPIDLMVQAAEVCADDAGSDKVIGSVDTVAVVPVMSWRYVNPVPLVASRLGIDANYSMNPLVGGNTPQMLMNRICERIVDGSTEIALLTGAEAVRTKQVAKREGRQLEWEQQPQDTPPADYNEGSDFNLAHPAEIESGLVMPIQAYPMFENALRHEANRTAQEQTDHIARIWEGFSKVASVNEFAWDQTHHSAAEIGSTHPGNRMVGFPYNIHMVSNQSVDMSSAILVTSVGAARKLGIDSSRWVFPHAGADGADPFMAERPNFTSSAAMNVAGNAALSAAGISLDEIAHLDVYSCFPSAVQIACKELNIDDSRQLTVWGGLCFGGGPWNNPVGHAIASMTTTLREDSGSSGFVTANGGLIQKHSFGVYSTRPPERDFRVVRPQSEIDAAGKTEVDQNHVGEVEIEAWTVMADREANLTRANLALRTPSGARQLLGSSDPDLMTEMIANDMVGRRGQVNPDKDFELS